MLVDDFYAYLNESDFSKNTKVSYMKDVQAFLEYESLPFSPKDLYSRLYTYFLSLKGTISDRSIKRKMSAISYFYDWVVEKASYFGENPMAVMRKKFACEHFESGKPLLLGDYLPALDVKKLLNKNREISLEKGGNDYMMLLLMCTMGLGTDEVRSLNGSDYSTEDNVLNLNGRQLFVNNGDLQSLLYYNANRNNFLFLNRNGMQMSDQSVRTHVKRMGEKAGIDNLKPGMLRCSFIKYSLEGGCNPKELSRQLNMSLEMINEYMEQCYFNEGVINVNSPF